MDLVSHQYEHAGVNVLVLAGELDLATAPRARQHLVRLVSEHAGAVVVIDLSGLVFCDSIGIGVLVGAQRRARQHGGEVRVVVPEGRAGDAFALAGLEAVLPTFPSLAAARA